MTTNFMVDNEGVGGSALLTMYNRDFTDDDLIKGFTACVITGPNTVGKAEYNFLRLFGKVMYLSQEVIPGTTQPKYCTVQARGVARFNLAAGIKPLLLGYTATPTKEGSVLLSPCYAVGFPAVYSGPSMISISDDEKTCDVWLG